jgi:hypothetical protein
MLPLGLRGSEYVAFRQLLFAGYASSGHPVIQCLAARTGIDFNRLLDPFLFSMFPLIAHIPFDLSNEGLNREIFHCVARKCITFGTTFNFFVHDAGFDVTGLAKHKGKFRGTAFADDFLGLDPPVCSQLFL